MNSNNQKYVKHQIKINLHKLSNKEIKIDLKFILKMLVKIQRDKLIL